MLRLFTHIASVLVMLAACGAVAGPTTSPFAKECQEPHESEACRYYGLDDVMGHSYALYPGSLYRSYVAPKYQVPSFEDLKKRVAALPEGSLIAWIPAARSHEGAPLLFGSEANVKVLQALCKDHKITLTVAGFACTQDAECASSCRTLEPAECRRSNAPACANHKCQCWDACL